MDTAPEPAGWGASAGSGAGAESGRCRAPRRCRERALPLQRGGATSPSRNPGSTAGRLVLALFLEPVGLFLRLVHCAVRVLRRAVNGVEDERQRALVGEVVLGAGRDHDQIALRDVAGLAADLRLPGAAD